MGGVGGLRSFRLVIRTNASQVLNKGLIPLATTIMESSEICTRIIRNFKNQFPDEDLEMLLSGKYRLGNCFRWGHTPEGYYFWRNCFNRFLYTTNDFVRFIKKYGNISITFIDLKKYVR